jgi:hypothetical protein
MPVRFATATGNWSNTAIWDNGSLPVSGDTVYPNGFTVTLDQDISVDGLNNNISPVYLPNMPIPLMTGNTQPSGVAFAGQNSSTAYQAFDYNPSTLTLWQSTNLTNCTIGYQFTSGKIIKRYYLFRQSENQRPTSWTFEGSNDGITWSASLDTVTANTGTTPYLSGILANTTSYLYYRINITAVSSGTIAYVRTFEMTESTATTYGTTTGGSFFIPNTLSGTRNIVFSGDGIKSNNISTTGVVRTSHISGSTVNFTASSGAFIINPSWVTASTSNNKAVAINGNGAINFNGNIWGQIGNIYNDTEGASININAGATITINGNVYGPAGNATSQSYTILANQATASSAILNINGEVIGSNLLNNSYPIYVSVPLSINITGNLTSNKSVCIFAGSSNQINIIGNVTVTDTLSANAIYMTATGSLITMNGSITNKGNLITIWAPKIRFASTSTPYWIFQTNSVSDMTLAYGSATGVYPTEADVRFGTTYAASPTRTGTLRVALPQYVSQGVLTDNTTGTAYINAADVWNVLSSSITTAGSIGERLKVASTVETTGDQLAAYIV